ncbi:hypothetical protein COI_1641 [Mannheimia haemolytica serotype A2 str. OVINE]|nr:hypothetical protein COI_1641 [Mannheimia haemolytica serotype A2 str. OVINE]
MHSIIRHLGRYESVTNSVNKVFLFQQVVCVLFGYAIISLTLNSV